MFAGISNFKNEKLWKAFLDAGADINKPNKFGKPPLLAMNHDKNYANSENEGLLEFLVKHGLRLNTTDSTNETVLIGLLETYNLEVASLQKSLDRGCSVKAKGQNGETVLHTCIRMNKPFEIFLYLVNAGADPMAVDNDGNSLFHALGFNGSSTHNLLNMKEMVDMGLPTDTPNKAGRTPLHIACAVTAVNHVVLDFLLGGNPNTVSNVSALDDLGASPMHYAASFSETSVVYLLRAGADSTLKTPEGLTPLHIAARSRASNVVGLLLSEYKKHGILETMVNVTDQNGSTPLHHACRSGRPESVRYLLSAGANFLARDNAGRTPLHALAEFPLEDLFWTSPQKGDQPEEFSAACVTLDGLERPFSSRYEIASRNAVPARTREILEMLERAGADIQTKWMFNGEEQTPMDVAVRMKCTELVNELRNRGLSAKGTAAESLIPWPGGVEEAKALLAPIGMPDPKKRATREGGQHVFKFEEILQQRDYNLFQEFAKVGGDLLVGGEDSLFPGLFSLVKWGHEGLLEIYSDKASRIDDHDWWKQDQFYSYHTTLLCYACIQAMPRLNTIKVLVEKVKVEVNRDGGNGTALHELANGRYFWQLEAMEYLLDHGANIEAKRATGSTPLLSALSVQHANLWKDETIRVLLDHGANPNAVRDEDGKSCLNLAGYAAVTGVLLKHGADVSIGKIHPLTTAIESMNIDTARLILDAGADPNNKSLPLYKAARPVSETQEEDLSWIQARREMVALLLEHGSDPFAPIDDDSFVDGIPDDGVWRPVCDFIPIR